MCSGHKTIPDGDADCHRQGAPRPQKGNANIVVALRSNTTRISFDEGFLFTITSDRRFTSSNSPTTFLVASGATEYCVDDALIPNLRSMLCDRKIVEVHKTFMTQAGMYYY